MPERRTGRGRRNSRARGKSSRASGRAGGARLSRDLKRLVGAEVYDTWMKMLKALVPWGRTHRLAVLVAGMLQYAAICGRRLKEENSVKERLEESAMIGMDEETQQQITLPIIEQLFKDAGVKWRRTNARGQRYSIAQEALEEFLHWDFMPWE